MLCSVRPDAFCEISLQNVKSECVCVYVFMCACVLQVTEGLHCVSPELCELTLGTLTLSLEVPEETAVK